RRPQVLTIARRSGGRHVAISPGMTRQHAQHGTSHEPTRPRTDHDAQPAHAPGRATPAHAAAPAPSGHAIDIARDRHDHRSPNPLGFAVDVQMRTLLAHLQYNLALVGSDVDRAGALDAIATRVEVAFMHVPAEQ